MRQDTSEALPRAEEDPPARPEPLISLCMIVKNEEELLPRFLAAAKGAWDELCVVDTGSTDGTVSLLEAAGARVVRRAWDDDFSAARNAGLEQATGRWILFLDADEMLTAPLISELRAVAKDDGAGAATLVMRNLLPHGHLRAAPLLRLFRRDPQIRFRFRIHEDVSAPVSDYLRRTGRRMVRLSGAIDHLGYVRERAAARSKKERDLRLLEACVAADPGDLYIWFKSLELARFWADGALLRKKAALAARALERAPAGALRGAHFGGELLALLSQGLFPGEPASALAFLSANEASADPSAAFHLRRGEVHELLGHAVAARADFLACLALAERTHDLQLATVRPLLGLARVAMATGDLPEAVDRTHEALTHNPRDPEALLAAVALARAQGGRAAVRALADALLRKFGDSTELHAALGDEAFLAGDLSAATDELRLAAGTPPSGRAALRLSQVFLARRDLPAARAVTTSLAASLPEAAVGTAVVDALEGRAAALDADLDPDEAFRALVGYVDALRRAGHADLVNALRRGAGALIERFPGLRKAL